MCALTGPPYTRDAAPPGQDATGLETRIYCLHCGRVRERESECESRWLFVPRYGQALSETVSTTSCRLFAARFGGSGEEGVFQRYLEDSACSSCRATIEADFDSHDWADDICQPGLSPNKDREYADCGAKGHKENVIYVRSGRRPEGFRRRGTGLERLITNGAYEMVKVVSTVALGKHTLSSRVLRDAADGEDDNAIELSTSGAAQWI